eukprot:TRINITY_DN2413_c0_g1_i2.p1 TRINITY_DN2413_c0_g1~~TRINITY_DN2413_c0_g1_i2.p1  ORF type:complete len:117 (-),score=5.43 TRINITY_DN2413_c0_g1_i2:75-425(-)
MFHNLWKNDTLNEEHLYEKDQIIPVEVKNYLLSHFAMKKQKGRQGLFTRDKTMRSRLRCYCFIVAVIAAKYKLSNTEAKLLCEALEISETLAKKYLKYIGCRFDMGLGTYVLTPNK